MLDMVIGDVLPPIVYQIRRDGKFFGDQGEEKVFIRPDDSIWRSCEVS